MSGLMPRPATVLLVVPSDIVRHGLQEVLGTTVAVVGTAPSGKQAIKNIKKLSPAVVLLADRLPDGHGLDVAASILADTKVAVVMVGVEENPTYLARAAAMGVSDYVFEGSSPKAIQAAVLNAAAGTPPAATAPFGRLKGSLHARGANPRIDLTPREQQVVRHIAYGLSNSEIARSLEISVETVKEHVQNVLRKMGMADRTHVAVWDVKSGMV
jgi:DNA-binding NarL/FixJ family response regulator